MTLYKTLDGTAGSYGNGDYSDYLPKGKRPGKWLPKVTPELCESGYHYCTDPLYCLSHYGPDLYEVEVRGKVVSGGDKCAAEQMRLVRRVDCWTDENLRLFAVDCARISVNRYAQDDQRGLLHACLDVTTAYAECGEEWAAARDAARDAAWAAARAAARAAAWDAAWDAAWAAAWAAARTAAGGAAWAAARTAAWAAARDAARSTAARDAAEAAQRAKFLEIVKEH